jgi:hypothetical protein
VSMPLTSLIEPFSHGRDRPATLACIQRLGITMDIRPLHTEDDYRAALAEVSAPVDLDPEPGTPEGDRLEILSILVEHYESLMETAHLLRSPANVAQLERFAAQLRAGKIKP